MRPIDVRSDIYSFGALLYYALTARLPFQDEEASALFAAHVSRPLAPIAEVSPQPVPAALERIVQRCMEKNPDDRFPSVRLLLDALDGVGAQRTLTVGGS